MAKNIGIEYNGEIGYLATIEEVVLNVFKIYEINSTEFLDYKKDEQSLSNREIVFQSYSIQDKIELGLSDEDGNDIGTADDITPKYICPYTTFYIDADYVTKNVILNNSNVLVDDFSVDNLSINDSFFNSTLNRNKFFQDYIKNIKTVDKEIPNSEFKENLNLKKQHLKPKVWIWCKSLNEDQTFNPNSIFDLSPFVESLETNVADSGGNFSIKLLPIEGFIKLRENEYGESEAEGYWSPKKDRYIKFDHNNEKNYLFKNYINSRHFDYEVNSNNVDIVSKTEKGEIIPGGVHIVKRSKKGDVSSDYFFKNLISENDIIFISFNEFDFVEPTDDFLISNDKLPGKDWHMIGLVDRNNISLSYENSEIGTNISGRDCMKLLIEDGSYFFPKSYSNETENSIFSNIDLPNSGDDVNTTNKIIDNGQKGAGRLIMSGMIEILFTAEARNINFVMNLLVSTLSNIEICPTRLFEYYGERVTKFQIPIYETVKKEDEEDNEI